MKIISKMGILLLMSSVMFLVLLDVTVLNVALPHIRACLGASVTQTQWIIDAYSITFAALLLAGGTIGDTYGHKFVVLFGLGIFAISSAAGGFSQNVIELIASRAVQGIGEALLLPGSLAIITYQFPKQDEQTKAIGIWASISSLALPVGPILGGLLIDSFGWRSIFAINTIVIIPLTTPTTKVVGFLDSSCHGLRTNLGLIAVIIHWNYNTFGISPAQKYPSTERVMG